MIKLLCSRWNLALIAALLSLGGAYGQGFVGAKIGLNLNQFTQPGTTVGLNAGAYGTYKVTPFLGFRVEALYSQEGGGRPDYSRSYSDISDNVYSIKFLNPYILFHNVTFPVLAELTLPEFSEETVRPKLLLGGSYGIMVAATEMHTKRYTFNDGTSTSPSPSPSELEAEPSAQLDVAYERETVTDNYTRNHWSVWAGIGLDFTAGDRSFSFDFRYRQGLNNLNLLRFASPGNSSGTIGVPGTGGEVYSSSVSFNFAMSIFKF